MFYHKDEAAGVMINGKTHSLGLNREREDIRQASRLALLTVQASRVL